MVWPKNSFGFFGKMVQKNLNELLDQLSNFYSRSRLAVSAKQRCRVKWFSYCHETVSGVRYTESENYCIGFVLKGL